MALTPLLVEYTRVSVSSSHVRPVLTSARPPQISTTLRPLTYRQNAAPTSPCHEKLVAKASRTPSYPGSTLPSMSIVRALLPSALHDTERALGEARPGQERPPG